MFKIWLFVIIGGTITSDIVLDFLKSEGSFRLERAFSGFFIGLIIILLLLSIPSLLIAHFFYYKLSSKKISNNTVCFSVLIVSLITLILPYYLLLNSINKINSFYDGQVLSVIVYAFFLSIGSIIFLPDFYKKQQKKSSFN